MRNAQNRGFVASCNRGARTAKGDILIFLNDDTMPQKGWLQALLRTFWEQPDAGAVGGKLIYPDGRLQEAGNFVFSDGSAMRAAIEQAVKTGEPVVYTARSIGTQRDGTQVADFTVEWSFKKKS